MDFINNKNVISTNAIFDPNYISHSFGLQWGQHRYVRREGSPGNWRYIYPEDLQNKAKGVASTVASSAKNIANRASNAIGVSQRKAAVNAVNAFRKAPSGAMYGNVQNMVGRYQKTPLGRAESAYGSAKKAVGSAAQSVKETVQPALKAVGEATGVSQRQEAVQAINWARKGLTPESYASADRAIRDYQKTPLGKVETFVAPGVNKFNNILRVLGAVKITYTPPQKAKKK